MNLRRRVQLARNDTGQVLRALERADWMAMAAEQFLKAYSEAAEREGWELSVEPGDRSLVETFNELRNSIHEYRKRTV